MVNLCTKLEVSNGEANSELLVETDTEPQVYLWTGAVASILPLGPKLEKK